MDTSESPPPSSTRASSSSPPPPPSTPPRLAQPLSLFSAELEQEPSGRHNAIKPVRVAAPNPALRALERQQRAGGGPSRTGGGPLAHMRNVLASPTDKIMSPATRGVHDIRRKKLSKEKLKPQALSMLFETMKQK
ncbi:hypothetical protein IWW38_002680 [Coemansia aciculifera]|uniref:Uncharacterized protein n=1 Tax=Coemansia aciculifera TaxID=417176 RepID=A0ACC1M4I7_9FUNG|nr:hypothetical protein IWW38_002680 [Coemansia aciculifera]